MMRSSPSNYGHLAAPAPSELRTVALSVVVPIYNEEQCVGEMTRRLTQVLEGMGVPYEVLLVNDGSRDRSLERMVALHEQDPRLKIVNLSRNFGHQLAVTAGLDHSTGEAVVIIDADLQDPPELIPELFQRFQEGYDVVFAVRLKREKESAFKLLTAKLFYRMFRWATDVDMPVDTGDFRLMSRKVVHALNRMGERHRMLRAMVSWVGFRQCGVPYERDGRFAGTTKYPFRKMLRFALDGMTSFSVIPLKLASWLGGLVSLFAFTFAAWALASHLLGGTVQGWTSIMVAVTFLGGIQLLCLGIIGEYLGRVYDESKGRPLYLVSDFHHGGERLDR